MGYVLVADSNGLLRLQSLTQLAPKAVELELLSFFCKFYRFLTTQQAHCKYLLSRFNSPFILTFIAITEMFRLKLPQRFLLTFSF